MDNNATKKIKEKFDTLPDDIKKAINEANLPERVEKISKKNDLLIDQTSDLYMEIFLAMLGIEPLADLTKNISKNVAVSAATALAISKDVNTEILLPIRESLEKIQLPQEEDVTDGESSQIPERDEILRDIENPQPVAERAPIIDPERELETRAAAETFVESKISATKAPAVEKKYSADPYREPLN